MDTPLLATKLFVPQPRPGLVARPRLVERLNGALSSGLVLVSAPAGFGKTTAVVQWALESKQDISVAWVSLDIGDNDPVRFWDYLIAALRTFQPAAGVAASSALHSAQTYSIDAVLTSLINDIADVPGDYAVVLDDYHLITSEAIHTGMAFLLEHLPPRMHLVIATRADPPLPLPHFRGRGTLVEVGADDLRFTDEEAARLLKEMLGTPLSAEQTASLNAHTEGWAVGLKTAALSMRGRKDTAAFLTSFTGSQRYVMDYLVEEVLKRQTEEVRDFLLKTSVLERMTASLGDVLTGGSRGRDMLVELDRANLFLVPLDESRQWYRYHHLFAELLRHQLKMHYGADEVTRLHRLASQWYESAGLIDDAARHSLSAKDFDASTRLIGLVADGLIGRGEWNTLFHWFQTIPEDVLRHHPAVYREYANVLLTRGNLEAADSVLDYLDRATGAEQDLQGQLAFLQSIVAYRRGDVWRMTELAQRALEQLPPDNLAARARLHGILVIYEWGRGALDRAWSRSLETLEIGKQAGEYWLAASASANVSQILWLRGKLSQALTVGQEAVESAGESPAGAFPRLILGYILHERNELEKAALNSQLSITLSELGGFAENRIAAYYCLAQGLQAQHEASQAEESMKRGDEASRHPTVSPMCRAIQVSNRVMLAIQQNDLQGAKDWGRLLAEYPVDTQWVWFQHAHARLAIALGDYPAARAHLARLYGIAVRADAQGYVIRIRVYQALAAANTGEALEFLADALKMGEAEGFIRTFVDEGRLLKPLLRKALSEGITPEYTTRLLNIIEAEDRLRQTGSGEAITPPVPASRILSERELEVLGLVAAGLSNGQIANRLVISPGTAKRHVHNIFEKLGAGDRLHAVSRARELGLIEGQ
jgi:LuxR family maltose regulon positive regulatory protein